MNKIVVALILLEVIIILGFMALCIYACLVFENEMAKLLITFMLSSIAIITTFRLGIDDYIDKHRKYKIVYYIKEKELNDEQKNNKFHH